MLLKLTRYRALKMGSTYAQAVAALGCEGEEMSRFELAVAPQFNTAMYVWRGGPITPVITAMFQGDKLISRSQLGLTK